MTMSDGSSFWDEVEDFTLFQLLLVVIIIILLIPFNLGFQIAQGFKEW